MKNTQATRPNELQWSLATLDTLGAPLLHCLFACLGYTSVGDEDLCFKQQNIKFRRANNLITDWTLTQILLVINLEASWKNIIYDLWPIKHWSTASWG